jgi:DNA-binding MarR family transcriptional regulator
MPYNVAMPESPEVEAWRGVLFAQGKVVRALETDMLKQHGLPLTWFEILSRLNQAPDHRLRMHELEEASVLTRSGLTRLSDRIEAAGFITRERSEEDRRGVHLVITKEGMDKIDEVWPDHVASIQKHFGQFLDNDDLESLDVATQKILCGVKDWNPELEPEIENQRGSV